MGIETLDQERAPSSPGRPGGATTPSFSNRVSELILQSCRLKDSSARISTILRDNRGRTVVRVRTGESSDAVSLLRALKDLWPLAKTAVVENQLDGTVEAQIVVPRVEDERIYARQKASSSRCAEFLDAAVVVLFLVGASLYFKDNLFNRYLYKMYSAANATANGTDSSADDDREL